MSETAEPLTFDRNFTPPYGKAEQLSALVTRVVCRNPGPFTFKGTASYLVGRKSLAVIDPGPEDTEHLDALVAAIGGRPVRHILVTHTHLDHSPLARRLKAVTGARTAGFGPHGAGLPQSPGVDMGGDTEFIPDIALREGDTIEGEDWSIGVLFTPGHASNHMAYALKQEKALFTGDHVMAWSTSVIAPPDGHMGQYLRSLEKLIPRADEIYWPAHGPPRRNPQGLVRGLLAHRRMREGALLARLKQGAADVAQLTASLYAEIDPRLHAAAAQTTLAHLHYLIEQGRVVREPSQNGEIYRLS